MQVVHAAVDICGGVGSEGGGGGGNTVRCILRRGIDIAMRSDIEDVIQQSWNGDIPEDFFVKVLNCNFRSSILMSIYSSSTMATSQLQDVLPSKRILRNCWPSPLSVIVGARRIITQLL